MNETKRYYTVQEKGKVVVVYYLRTWRHYLLGSKFTVKTDNIATSYFLKQKKLIPKLIQWQPLLVEFDFVIEYKLSKVILAADALSKRVKLAIITMPQSLIADKIKEGIQHDPQAKSLYELASQGKTRRFWLWDGLLHTKGEQLYIPR